MKHHIIPLHEWRKRFNPKATRYNKEFNTTDNLVELTIEQHAEAHKILFEQFGNWEDMLAWKGLLGEICREDYMRENTSKFASMGGKALKGIPKTLKHKESLKISSRQRWDSDRGKNERLIKSKKWKVTTPKGVVILIHNLKEFCREHNLQVQNMNHVAKGRRKHHQNYKCESI